MGIKFLSLHMIPWCFHLRVLGRNILSCLLQQQQQRQLQTDEGSVEQESSPSSTSRSIIRLIDLDGLVKIYHRPVHVSELMLEFPKHLVCDSESFYIGQKIPALSESDKLQPGNNYFLLPKHFFQSVLSFVTIASLSSPTANNSHSHSHSVSKQALLKKAPTCCQPFDIRRTPSGSLQIRVSDGFISKLMAMEEVNDDTGNPRKGKAGVCTTSQLHKDYTQLVGCRQWKPKLETIRELERRKFSTFAMKRRKKKKKKKEKLPRSQNRSGSAAAAEEEDHPRRLLTSSGGLIRNTPKGNVYAQT